MKLAALLRPAHPLRLAGAAGVGVIWAAAFPRPDFSGAAWVTPALLLGIAWGLRGGDAFRTGYVAGLAHYLTSLYWLLHIPFLPGAVTGWLALSAYLALYPAIWVWLTWRWVPSAVVSTMAPQAFYTASMVGATASPRTLTRPRSSRYGFIVEAAPRFPGLDPVMNLTWGQRFFWSVSAAALWVALEMVRGWLLGGFPWNNLGASLHEVLPLAQLASLTGVTGLSFLMVWFSLALTGAVLAIARSPTRRLAWVAELALPLTVLGGVMFWGAREMVRPWPTRGELRVVLVQPSIPQTLIWDPAENTNRFQKLVELSELALSTQPDLLIWPESAVPNLLRYHRGNYQAITNLIGRHQAWMILGADDAEPRAGDPETGDYYNSSFLLSPDGRFQGAYRKQHLVPFGEFIPLARWLPFLKRLAPIGDGFEAGDGPALFRLGKPEVTTSVLICFEDVFAPLARKAAAEGPDFLLNLTNNGWFGESAAQWQHAANSTFRAIENRIPLVRCANNGLTCWVDPFGRKREIFQDESRNIYAPGFKSARIPLPAAEQSNPRTFYQAFGDWFGWGCAGVAGLLAILSLFARREPAP